ncbi:hypothetical protein GGI25_002430 [Coemansia spiralis]|uniref:DH domain-containing protein n=1 Tax=Coemansia spiralis TaxID=417178 RepID=A0A9W8GAG8_9FUNG|nr:hypothetical protein GGI25_002430 [Coemansia spiralis]
MAKSKLLVKTALKSTSVRGDNEPEPAPAVLRPQTAGGERGLLRRLRFGRLFFGLGSTPSAASSIGSVNDVSAGVGSPLTSQQLLHPKSARLSGSETDLLARSSRLVPVPMQPAESYQTDHAELPSSGIQTITVIQRRNMQIHAPQLSESNSNPRFSVLSKRSSAPDIVELGRQLSRCTESSGTDSKSTSSSSASSSNSNSNSNSHAYVDGCIGGRDANSAELESKQSRVHQASSFRNNANFNKKAKSTCSDHASLDSGLISDNIAPDLQAISPSLHLGNTARLLQESDEVNESRDGSDISVSCVTTFVKGVFSNSHSSHDLQRQNQQLDFVRDEDNDITYPSSIRASSDAIELSADTSLQKTNTAQFPCNIGSDASDANQVNPPQTSKQQSDELASITFAWKGIQKPTSNTPTQPLPTLPQYEKPADGSAGMEPVILMGSVKQRGDKKTGQQSVYTSSAENLQSMLPLPPPPQPLQFSNETPRSLSSSVDSCTESLKHDDSVHDCASAKNDSSSGNNNNGFGQQHSDASTGSHAPSLVYQKNTTAKSGWPRSLHAHTRPKSLYEQTTTRSFAESQLDSAAELLPPGTSSSIASAKAFLTMIASGGASASSKSLPAFNNLTVVTLQAHQSPNLSQSDYSPISPALSSAPLTKTEASLGLGQSENPYKGSNIPASLDFDRHNPMQKDPESSFKDEASPVSPGAKSVRSLRSRSRLASVGIRRASTYVWSRSSVFMRSLASADELPTNTEQLQQQQELLQPSQLSQQQPQLQLNQNGGSWGNDTDTGSTKTEANLENEHGTKFTKDMGLANNAEEHTVAKVPPPPVLPSHKRSPAAMRLHAARELVMTEKNFVDNLFVIKKVWMEPVFSSANSPKPIIPYQTARIVFFGIAALHSHASQFYRDMDYVLGSFERSERFSGNEADDGVRIGALFRAKDRHWSDFIAYVRNYGAAVNCLKQLQNYKPYIRYHEECMLQKRTNRQSLKDLLMLPIQRITRYTLLLKNVLKHTPAVHGDHIDLCRAVKNVTHFASIVNECRRKQEEMYRLIEIFRTIEQCPPLPHSESRSFVSEFFVRELISRLPTRLLLFSDMLVVAQTSAQTKMDDTGNIDSAAEWTYYGSAFLDDVEVQNADESTSTLITILSLNRRAASADQAESARRSLPSAADTISTTAAALSATVSGASSSGSIPGLCTYSQASAQKHGSDTSLSTESRSKSSASSFGPANSLHIQRSGTTSSENGPLGLSNKKKKSKSRRGLLRVSSRDSIPDHIAALSHSTFPSPVPCPNQIERPSSRLHHMPSATTVDMLPERDTHPFLLHHHQQQHQRPKTASGSTSRLSASQVHPPTLLHGSSSNSSNNNSTFVNHAGMLLSELPSALRAHHPEYIPNNTANIHGSVSSRADATPVQPVQLTLVMQHVSSVTRKQFVRALKEATTRHASTTSSLHELDISGSDPAIADSSSEILSLHPL